MEINEEIVSLIIPCYNADKYINRALDSVFNQTYSKIELILINDGSTDNTNDIIVSWIPKLEQALWKVIYLKQDNGGVGAAVNLALKSVTGEYIALLDSDDYMMPNAIEVKVNWLQSNKEYAVVRNNGLYVDERDFFGTGRLFYNEDYSPKSDDMFEDILSGAVINWPGSYMIRTNVWLSACPNREIFPSRHGQNLQMLLPATYRNKTGYIDAPLMRYSVREDSLSHFSNDPSGSKAIKESYNYNEIYCSVIDQICNVSEAEQYKKMVNCTSCRMRMEIASRTSNKEVMRKNFNELREYNAATLDDWIKYARLCNRCLALILRGFRKTRYFLQK